MQTQAYQSEGNNINYLCSCLTGVASGESLILAYPVPGCYYWWKKTSFFLYLLKLCVEKWLSVLNITVLSFFAFKVLSHPLYQTDSSSNPFNLTWSLKHFLQSPLRFPTFGLSSADGSNLKKKSNNFKCLLLNPSEGIGGREMNNDCLEQLQTRFWLKLRLSDAVMLGCA